MLCISIHDTKGQIYKWLATAQTMALKKITLSGFKNEYKFPLLAAQHKMPLSQAVKLPFRVSKGQ